MSNPQVTTTMDPSTTSSKKAETKTPATHIQKTKTTTNTTSNKNNTPPWQINTNKKQRCSYKPKSLLGTLSNMNNKQQAEYRAKLMLGNPSVNNKSRPVNNNNDNNSNNSNIHT